jgi:P4 family phage/plasmid primase-like protien
VSTTARTFADHVADYAAAGWPCILPVPPETKTPPPTGFTGAEGRDTDPLTLVGWAGSHAGHSIALRMPLGVIGIDVDQYAKGAVQKRGAETLAHFVERWGPLPATWTSTARGDGPSRIHFFRVPEQRYATKLDTGVTSDIEIIQRHHRYAVVWPSVHAGVDTGAGPAIYRWYDPTGAAVDVVPRPEWLPELPQAWVQGLAAGATQAAAASSDRASGEALLDQLLADVRPECAEVTSARQRAIEELGRADAGSRHDTMTERTHHLIQLAAAGHPGVSAALLGIRELWENITAGEGREDELERAFLTSARKAVTVVGAVQVPRDPCLFMAGGVALPEYAPAAEGPIDPETGKPTDLTIVEPPRWVSVRQVIGAEAFDPVAGLDQPLAEAVLQRIYPVLRYAYDADGWLLRAPNRWEMHRSLSAWAVATLASLMPIGDPTADKESEQFERSKRRARLMTSAGARAVAKMMDALVAAGMHPASIKLADLDADPEILWAGGLPWSLRFSDVVPVVAEHVDPATPHLHSAGVTPEARPTPLWDAFLAAVWPDAEVRAWAIRVLSIALTGYADRALPILLGETGRGKTQVVALIMSLLGSYAHAANPKLLIAGANEHDTIRYQLKGRRLSFIDEAPGEAKSSQERLKELTGGGELEARQMNQNPITFRPTHTLVLTANDEPLLTDPAVRSRVRLIPCEGDPELVRTTRAAIGPVAGPAWRAEAPGVLAKLMAEAAAWLADPMTAHVTAAPERLRYLAEHIGAEQDPVTVWLEEETEPSETGTASRELYQAFTASCLRNNLRRDQIPSETKWGRTLTRLGYPVRHTEHGKRRPLQLRTGGGHLPTAGPSPAQFMGAQPTNSAERPTPGNPDKLPDGFAQADGLLTGSPSNPSGAKPQVNHSVSVEPDGLTGLETPTPHMYAHAHAHESRPPDGAQPVSPTVGEQPPIPGLTCENAARKAADGLNAETRQAPKSRKKAPADPAKTEAAREKRAQAAAEKRAAAIAEAAGRTVTLPALVTRDGTVTEIGTADADQLLATITGAEDGELTVDVENTGYPVGHRHYALRTVQLGNENFAVVLDPHAEDQADVVRRHMAAAAILHAHSATADLVPLADAGLLDLEAAWDRMHDTVVLAKLVDPELTGSDPGLKKISAAMLGQEALSPAAEEARIALFKAGKWLTETKVTTPVERSGWAQVDSTCETMVRYAASDVLDDAAIARRLPHLDDALLHRERTAQRMTARITHVGLPIDGDHVEEMRAKHTALRSGAADRVRELGRGLIENPGSNQQVGDALTALGAPLPRTATGRPSVAEGVLDPFTKVEGPIGELAAAVLSYREHDTALGLFLEPYHQLVVNGDGRARPTIYTLAADTGRMSSVRPNFQQVTREGGFRACINADPGYLLASADFQGVEFRVAAALSQDPNLIRMLLEGVDLHRESAKQVFGPDATKSDRYQVKRGNFGWLYGGRAPTLAKQMGVTEATAQALIDTLGYMLPGVTAWTELVKDGVQSGRTQFRTYSGRVVHLPKKAPHAGPNYCIQGTARELLIDALMRWSKTKWGDCVLFPVHDEIVAMVPEDEAEEATAALVECMATELHGVPIVADANTPAFAWQDAA